MDENEYKSLLEKAYSELPQVLYKAKRFEVPQVKGRLVKSRTIVNNFRDIAKHLQRDEVGFATFMLKELGVRGEVDMRGELILHSRFQPAMLNKAVDKFYRQYVECSHCNSPDTELVDNGTLLKCKACGHQQRVAKL